MSKKRKTRKEKKLADIRKTEHSATASSPTVAYSFSSPTQKHELPQPTANEVVNHSYVMKDIRKTLIISAFLVTFNLIVYALLRNNIINLSFLGL